MLQVPDMRLTPERLSIIKTYEGLRLQTYDDATGLTLNADSPQVGTVRIGYGNSSNPSISVLFTKGDIITEKQADEFLSKAINQKEDAVNSLVTGRFATGNIVLNQNQFDALVMLIFNVGESAIMKGKTIRDCLEKKDYLGASEGFTLWCKVNGQINDRLKERRLIEKEIFLT